MVQWIASWAQIAFMLTLLSRSVHVRPLPSRLVSDAHRPHRDVGVVETAADLVRRGAQLHQPGRRRLCRSVTVEMKEGAPCHSCVTSRRVFAGRFGRSIALCAASLMLVACGGGPDQPQATTTRIPNLPTLVRVSDLVVHDDATGPGQRATVYATTRLTASRAGAPISPNPPGQRVDVIVLRGKFVCRTCGYNLGSAPPRSRVVTLVVVPGQGVRGFELGGPKVDRMGIGYRLPVA